MRDNGLTAASYSSLGGIDPLVAEPVLAALAEVGIAAYCENQSEARTPAVEPDTEPDTAANTDSATQEGPGEPVHVPAGYDEIFVDAEAVERARPVIERSTEDAEWASLVEQFNQPSAPGHDGGDDPVPRWPVSEDVDEKYEPLIDVPSGLVVAEPADEEADERPPRKADDPHDHFIPPEPPRGPRLDWISRVAWLGLIGGPLLLILAALLDFGTGRITTLAVVGFIGGFLTLVIRMKDRLPPGDSGDDGAVV
ncbi:hypothetical protein AB0E69_36665 [Kribbella sp. NPDC026611]|uniref:hypothetical protein n=1 Tax=Kribbella sp. NPDC026611 TaxID=3154911 RepID=UPI0033D7805F